MLLLPCVTVTPPFTGQRLPQDSPYVAVSRLLFPALRWRLFPASAGQRSLVFCRFRLDVRFDGFVAYVLHHGKAGFPGESFEPS